MTSRNCLPTVYGRGLWSSIFHLKFWVLEEICKFCFTRIWIWRIQLLENLWENVCNEYFIRNILFSVKNSNPCKTYNSRAAAVAVHCKLEEGIKIFTFILINCVKNLGIDRAYYLHITGNSWLLKKYNIEYNFFDKIKRVLENCKSLSFTFLVLYACQFYLLR